MFVYLILPGHNCCAVDLRNGLWWRSIWRWLPPSSHLHCQLHQRCVAHVPFVFLRCVYKLKSGQSSCTSLFIHCCSWISLLPPNNISAEPNQCCGYKAIMSVMLCLTANSLSVMWDNHTTENRDWISWWLSNAGFLHPTPLVSSGPHVSDPVTTDCLFSQLCLAYFCHPLQLQRDAYVTQHTMHDHQRRCLSERNQFSPSVLALPFPIAQSSAFLLSVACVLSLSCLYERTVGVPSWLLTSTATTLPTNHNTVWSLFFMKHSAQR